MISDHLLIRHSLKNKYSVDTRTYVVCDGNQLVGYDNSSIIVFMVCASSRICFVQTSNITSASV